MDKKMRHYPEIRGWVRKTSPWSEGIGVVTVLVHAVVERSRAAKGSPRSLVSRLKPPVHAGVFSIYS